MCIPLVGYEFFNVNLRVICKMKACILLIMQYKYEIKRAPVQYPVHSSICTTLIWTMNAEVQTMHCLFCCVFKSVMLARCWLSCVVSVYLCPSSTMQGAQLSKLVALLHFSLQQFSHFLCFMHSDSCPNNTVCLVCALTTQHCRRQFRFARTM